MMRTIPAVALATAVLALGACGGGGGGGSPASRTTDTWVVGDVLVYAYGDLYRAQTSCQAARCTISLLGETDTIDFDEVLNTGPDPQLGPVSTRNGIEMASISARDGTTSFRGYAAWAYPQAFFVLTGTDSSAPGIDLMMPVSFGDGSSRGTNPAPGSAAWNGAMIGKRVGIFAPGADVVGDARLVVDFGQLDVDVSFTNIAERGTGQTVQDMNWQNLPMRAGTFRGAGLEGRFYGPNHEGAGGVFERSNITGAFGATRE